LEKGGKKFRGKDPVLSVMGCNDYLRNLSTRKKKKGKGRCPTGVDRGFFGQSTPRKWGRGPGRNEGKPPFLLREYLFCRPEILKSTLKG